MQIEGSDWGGILTPKALAIQMEPEFLPTQMGFTPQLELAPRMAHNV